MSLAEKQEGRRRWIIAAALVLLAFWPRAFDLDDLPADAPLGYREEALTTFWLAHDHPVQRAWFGLLAQNIALRYWRYEPGSCDAMGGGGTSWPHIRDVRTTLTVIGPWGLPLARETITCGGAGWRA